MNTYIKTILLNSLLFLLPLLLFPNLVSGADTQQLNNRNAETVPAASALNVIVVPFQLIGNMIIVKAKVNGKEGNFVVDTGADMMVLHARFFSDQYETLSTNSVSINDQTAEMKVVVVNFNWMGIARKNMSAKIIDLSLIEKSKGIPITGFIGYPMLKKFEILFDYKEKILTLFRLDRKGNRLDKFHSTDSPTHQIKLNMAYHFPYIKLYNGGEPIHLIIDSGAEMNILSPQAEQKLSEHLVYVNTRHLIGFGQERIPCKEYRVHNFSMEDMELNPMHTLIQSMEGFNKALKRSLDGFLGYEFLSQQKTSINFKKKELMIWLNKEEPKESLIQEGIVLNTF